MCSKPKKSLCIVAHRYLPYNGVNGVRWINLSKELADLGYSVTVLTVWRPGLNKYDLTQGGRIKVEIVKSNPIYLLVEYLPKSITGKIIKGLALKLASLFIIDDYADRWRNNLEPFVQRFSQRYPDGILIGTGAPFQVCVHVAFLAKKYRLKSIVDFQDPWFDDKMSNESLNLSQFRKDQFNFVKNNTDFKVFVTDGLMHHYAKNKILNSHVIENAHNFYQLNNRESCNEFNRWLYLGTLSNGRDEAMINWIKRTAKQKPVKHKLVIDVYGRVSERMRTYIRNNPCRHIEVNLCGFIEHQNILAIAKKYSAALQINASAYPYLVSTKVYEYPALGLPTLSLNYGGEIVELIEKNGIGVSQNLNEETISIKYLIHKLSTITQNDLSKFANENGWKQRAIQFKKLMDKIL